MMHQGNGLYAGDIKLLDTGAGYGNLAIFASNYDWSNPKEGRYSYTDIQTPEYGVAYTVSRYRGDNSILLPPGEYAVTFDMDNNTARFDAKAFYCTMPAAGYSTFYSDKSAQLLHGRGHSLCRSAGRRSPQASAYRRQQHPRRCSRDTEG